MHVLVVDDSSLTRRVIRRELEAAGHEVSEARDAMMALQALRQQTPQAVTLGADMVGLDGYQTCGLLRGEIERLQRIDGTALQVPVVMVTAADSEANRERGLSVGATEFIGKPFPRGSLAALLRRLTQPSRNLHGCRALVVDDSDVARQSIRRTLETRGVEVLEADGGEAALELVAALSEPLDVVLADYMMPGMKGDVLCQRLRALPALSDVPIIVLSAMCDRSCVIRNFRAGANDYVLKPFNEEELIARIDTHVRHCRINRQLADKVAELEVINEAKTRFLAVTSHDLRSPLANMLGYFHLALDGKLEGEDKERVRDVVALSAGHLTSILDDLAALCSALLPRAELAAMPVAIQPLIDETCRLFEPAAKLKRIKLTVGGGFDGAAVMEGDPNAVRRMLNNLLSNAIKFTHDGGRVCVALEREGERTALVSVEDDGVGIPQHLLKGLFDEYNRNSQPGTNGERGTGFGLSIVKHLAEQHRGWVGVSSSLGRGSCFTLALPLVSIEDEPRLVQQA